MNIVDVVRERYSADQNPVKSERRLELVLLGLLLILAVQLIWFGLMALSSPGLEPVKPASDSMLVSDAHEPGSITASQSLQLQSRPLFWQSRRPTTMPIEEATSTVVSNAKAAKKLQELAVSGVIGAGSEGAAIVEYKGKRMRLRVGDDVDGWTLQSVQDGEATFVSAGVSDVRRLLPKPVVAPQKTPEQPQAVAAPPSRTSVEALRAQQLVARERQKQQAKKTQNKSQDVLTAGGR